MSKSHYISKFDNIIIIFINEIIDFHNYLLL